MTLAFINKVKFLWQGDQHRLYAYDHSKMLELDCSEIPFRKLRQFKIEPELFCFAPSPFEILISGDKNQIKAISCETDKTIWSLDSSKEIDGKKLDLKSLVFSTYHNALLVCDAIHERILVFDPRDGSHLQTIKLSGMGNIFDLCPYDDKFIVLHCTPSRGYHLSHFSVN